MADAALRPPAALLAEGLALRAVQFDDAAALYEGWTRDPEAMRYLPWRAHTDVAETEAFTRRAEADWASGAKYRFLVSPPGPSAPAVGLGMLKIEEGCRAEVGFVVFPPARGRGVATRIARGLSDWALAQPSIWRAFGICDTENLASARALAKAGFALEGRWRRFHVCPAFGDVPRAVDCWVRLRTP